VPSLARPIRRNFPRFSSVVNYAVFFSSPAGRFYLADLGYGGLVRRPDTFIHANFYSATRKDSSRDSTCLRRRSRGGGGERKGERGEGSAASRGERRCARESILSDPTNFSPRAHPSPPPSSPPPPAILPGCDATRKSDLGLNRVWFRARVDGRESCSISLSIPRRHRYPARFPPGFSPLFGYRSLPPPLPPPHPPPLPRPSRHPSDNTASQPASQPASLPALFRRRSRDVKRARNRLGRRHSRGTISREYIP
jgi:hypothetical protein